MLQDRINEIVDGFLSGGAAKARARELYQASFDLEEIQSKAVRSAILVPNRWLEFDRNRVEILERLFSPERIEQLTSGADPRLENGTATVGTDCRKSRMAILIAITSLHFGFIELLIQGVTTSSG